MKKNTLRIATRKSKLALWQANFIKSAIEENHPDYDVSLIEIVTDGDREQNRALSNIGGKSNFVKGLQEILLQSDADIAVHSMKDMSAYDTPGLTLAAICERADPRDAFISNHYTNILSLPENAVVGTASPRRESILKSIRPDLQIKLLRGNVDTRIAKLDQGEYDAIILAAAGLNRLELTHRISAYLSPTLFTPAIAQGAIGIECRDNAVFIRDLLRFLHHTPTALCVMAERRVNQLLGGDCHTAIGAHATLSNDQIQLAAMIGNQNGSLILRADDKGDCANNIMIAEKVAGNLIAQGANELLARIK